MDIWIAGINSRLTAPEQNKKHDLNQFVEFDRIAIEILIDGCLTYTSDVVNGRLREEVEPTEIVLVRKQPLHLECGMVVNGILLMVPHEEVVLVSLAHSIVAVEFVLRIRKPN